DRVLRHREVRLMLSEQQRRRRHFHDELDTLQNKLLEMAGIVEKLLWVAIQSLERRDPKPAEWVKAEDDRVDELEVIIDGLAMDLLAPPQPMPRALRRVAATLKVANAPERVGAHAVNIAKAVRRLSEAPAFPAIPEVVEMAEIGRGML